MRGGHPQLPNSLKHWDGPFYGGDATAAAYRQTVFTAMQQVEDNLAALRILEGEAVKLQDTIQAANRALTVSTAQYAAGTVNYLTVITAQAALLNAKPAR